MNAPDYQAMTCILSNLCICSYDHWSTFGIVCQQPSPKVWARNTPSKGFFPVPFGHGLSGGEYEAQGEKNVTIKPMCWHERYE